MGNHRTISTESVQSVILEMVTKLWNKMIVACNVVDPMAKAAITYSLRIKLDLKQFQKNNEKPENWFHRVNG